MKKIGMIKIGVASLGAFLALTQIPTASAASTTCVPTVTTGSIKNTSLEVDVVCASAKSTKVDVKVQIRNNDNNQKITTKSFKGKTSKTGSLKIKMEALDTGTSYDFRAKVKADDKSDYSTYSSYAAGATKGASYKPEIYSITSVTENSAKVTVSSADLKKKIVNVQLQYKKKSSWTTKEYTLTLDKNGKGKVSVTGLSGDSKYDFKVRMKKTVDSKYSLYSPIKSATTDDN